jgi:hypothetical protein
MQGAATFIEDIVLNYDPEFPQERFRAAGVAGADKSSRGRLPGAVPWPEGRAPVSAPLTSAPAATDDWTRFTGFDAVTDATFNT